MTTDQPVLIDESEIADRAIRAACTAFSVTRQLFMSGSRRADLCNARRTACNLMFEAGITNHRAIAWYISRSHATVYHHIATHRNLYEYNLQYRKSYDSAKSIYMAAGAEL